MSAPGHGAFVISLDFELHWGIRDHLAADGPYRSNLLGVRQAIPAMLDLFGTYDIKATWATVGFLFCDDRDDMVRYAPAARPAYARPGLSPYEEPLGQDEAEDPIHFAPTLINLIAATPGQEIATHTFSHFYCLERGQDAETFRADLESAISVARKRGIELRSIVFPRNQFNPAYGAVLRDLGLDTYRGNQSGAAYKGTDTEGQSTVTRVRRLVDAYAGPAASGLLRWEDIPDGEGLYNVAASRFLRPYSRRLARLEPLRVRRITASLDAAAERHQLFHLWWHPHNFGANLEANLANLRQILKRYHQLHDRHGLRSMTMADVADAVRTPADA